MTSKAEKSYIQSSLCSDPPFRGDGRSLVEYRDIQLAIGVSALANGSARVNLGGTEILAACKLEVEDVESLDAVDGGRISCAVTWLVFPNCSLIQLIGLGQFTISLFPSFICLYRRYPI